MSEPAVLYSFVKRLFDIFFSIFAVFLLFIPWIIISFIIKIQSPGPVVYKAERIGLNGRVFTLYKFRSMRVDSGLIHITTLNNDSRVFPFGKFLRKTKLDETLQFLNIIKGDMSIIGPRPEDKDNANFIFVGKYKKILQTLPGLSSPASLFDYTHGDFYESEDSYNKLFLPKKLELELYYIENKNMWYDIVIFFRTIAIIFLVVCGKKSFPMPKEFNKINTNI